MRGAMKMALIRNEYGNGGATSRRRRDERGRYMEGDEYAAPRSEYNRYLEYDERPSARQMGFGNMYDERAAREMRGGYASYNRADMNINDQHRMNSGGKHGEFAEMGEHKRHYEQGGMKHMEDYRKGGDKPKPLTREKAEEWVESMQNEDPNREEGECWTLDEAKAIAKKMGMPTEGKKLIEFYAVINAMYSDYYKVAEKFDLVEDDFFAELAKAFIEDKDAVKDKVAVYYDCIVEK